MVKSWDVIIVGGGIIGLSLARELRKRSANVLVLERGELGREASHAAAGMICAYQGESPAALHGLAKVSAGMYPEFVHELQDESGINPDLRDAGTLLFPPEESAQGQTLSVAEVGESEPALVCPGAAMFLKERSVDPRALTAAAIKAAKHREVDISSGTRAIEVLFSDGRVAGVRTDRTSYSSPVVVNCAGAWAGSFGLYKFPARPVKGQMLSVVGAAVIQHVIRTEEVYLVPRSDGRILIGATVEEAGFDKRVDADTILGMHEAALRLVPALSQGRVLESWAGLRPGTPDNLPIIGETDTPGYFVATGHFRDGILLAPITALVMSQIVSGDRPEFELTAFRPQRFHL